MPSPRKNQSSLIIPIAIIILGVAAGYFYYSFSSGVTSEVSLPQISPQDDLSKFDAPGSFDFSLLENPGFKSLRVLGQSPVEPGPTGRTDPFLPF